MKRNHFFKVILSGCIVYSLSSCTSYYYVPTDSGAMAAMMNGQNNEDKKDGFYTSSESKRPKIKPANSYPYRSAEVNDIMSTSTPNFDSNNGDRNTRGQSSLNYNNPSNIPPRPQDQQRQDRMVPPPPVNNSESSIYTPPRPQEQQRPNRQMVPPPPANNSESSAYTPPRPQEQQRPNRSVATSNTVNNNRSVSDIAPAQQASNRRVEDRSQTFYYKNQTSAPAVVSKRDNVIYNDDLYNQPAIESKSQTNVTPVVVKQNQIVQDNNSSYNQPAREIEGPNKKQVLSQKSPVVNSIKDQIIPGKQYIISFKNGAKMIGSLEEKPNSNKIIVHTVSGGLYETNSSDILKMDVH